MAERYSRVYSLPNNLYTQKSPLVIKAGALLKDNQSNFLIAQLKLHNVSNRAIKFVKVELVLFDSLGRDLDASFTFDYLDLRVPRGADFGSQTPIKISESNARSYSVKVLEVGFGDNTIWNSKNNIWDSLPTQKQISFVLKNDIAVRGYQTKFGTNANMAFCEHLDLWMCACGHINHCNENYCYHCNASHEELKNITVENLINESIYSTACQLANSTNVDNIKKLLQNSKKLKDLRILKI